MKLSQVLSRRSFLQASSAASLCLVCAPALTQALQTPQPTGPKFSAMLWNFFGNRPLLEKLDLVGKTGLRAYEFVDWRNEDLDAIAGKAASLKLELSCILGNRAFGHPEYSLVRPDARENFIREISESIPAVKKLGGRMLIVLSGDEQKDLSREEQHRSIIAGLKAVAPMCEREAVTLVLEPLNTFRDHKGYYLVKSEEAFRIIDAVASPRVKVLFDIYHQQISEGNLIANIRANIDKIGHFHVGDVPGRHEPGTGEINYPKVLEAIVKTGYTGYIGLEYIPLKDHLEQIIEMRKLGAQLGIG